METLTIEQRNEQRKEMAHENYIRLVNLAKKQFEEFTDSAYKCYTNECREIDKEETKCPTCGKEIEE